MQKKLSILSLKHNDNYQSHSIRSCSVKLKILVCFNEVIMTPHLKAKNTTLYNNNIIVYCYLLFYYILSFIFKNMMAWVHHQVKCILRLLLLVHWWQSAAKCSHEHLPPTNMHMARVWFPEGRTGGFSGTVHKLKKERITVHGHTKFVFPNSENKKARYSF